MTPEEVMRRLGEIEEKLGEIQNDWEEAAGQHASMSRDWKRREHLCLTQVDGPSEAVKKARAFIRACEQDDLYDTLSETEEALARARTLYEVLDRRASIGQSILKAMTAEHFRSGPQPEWSQRVPV